MKKLTLLCAALLLGGPIQQLFAQEELEDSRHEPEPITLEAIARFDMEPQIALHNDVRERVRAHNNMNGKDGFYANSSVYTHFEGDIIPGLHFNLVNHWLCGTGDGIVSLYKNAWTTENNWCDYATLSYEFPFGLKFTAGKECLAVATYEYEPYDYDCHPLLCSGMWNNFNAYQLGAKASWCFSDTREVGFQVSSSPFNYKPFSEGLFAYSLYGFFDKNPEDELGFSGRVALNAMQFEKKVAGDPASRNGFVWMPSLGLRLDVNDFWVGIDAAARFASESSYFGPKDPQPIREGNVILNLGYAFEDDFEVFARAGWEPCHGTYSFLNYYEYTVDEETGEEYAVPFPKNTGFCGGVGINWYPLTDSQDLRVHAVVGGSNYARSLAFNIGITYFFKPLQLFARK